MKKYLNVIKISAIFLLLFPFLGLPELWEYLYVIIFSFIIGSSAILLHHKSGLIADQEEESSLQEYLQELKNRFKEQTETPESADKKTKISDIDVDKSKS